MNWLGMLGVVLVLGKLFGYITLSWWWVTLPFWVGLAFLGVILLVGGVSAGVGLGGLVLWDKWTARRRRSRR
jgi:hypothetical protein